MGENQNIVKKVCKELGLTYKQLGEAIGYSESAISNSARGTVSEPIKKAIELYLENQQLKKKLDDVETLKRLLKNFFK